MKIPPDDDIPLPGAQAEKGGDARARRQPARARDDPWHAADPPRLRMIDCRPDLFALLKQNDARQVARKSLRLFAEAVRSLTAKLRMTHPPGANDN